MISIDKFNPELDPKDDDTFYHLSKLLDQLQEVDDVRETLVGTYNLRQLMINSKLL